MQEEEDFLFSSAAGGSHDLDDAYIEELFSLGGRSLEPGTEALPSGAFPDSTLSDGIRNVPEMMTSFGSTALGLPQAFAPEPVPTAMAGPSSEAPDRG